MPSPPKIEINSGFARALQMMNDPQTNVFITGRAGTGKSTLLEHWRDTTKKPAAVLAPTGVAALNVKGQTIHSFFGFGPSITPGTVKKLPENNKKKALYKKLDAIVIDEISMVRADLLDCIDKFLRLNGRSRNYPFGGVKMIFIGDLYQLPPVVTSDQKQAFAKLYETPYFFSAEVFGRRQGQFKDMGEPFIFELIELEKIYRQSDRDFIRILNGVRTNTAADEDFALLNTRYDPAFEPESDDFWIHLTTTNHTAAAVNERRLAALKGAGKTFYAKSYGKVDQKSYPTDERLSVKVGAQVMMVNNDRAGRWVNGSVGRVAAFAKDKDTGQPVVMVEFPFGVTEAVEPHTWDVYEWRYAPGEGVVAEPVGSFSQYPFRLAWAVTIHKSQGKTFDRAIVDVERGTFAPGQMYVALSRCRTLEGLVLKQKISQRHILRDWRVVKFLTEFQYRESEAKLSLPAKIALIKQAIANQQKLQITYLKAKDEKSCRLITPRRVEEMEYMGKTYMGIDAYCHERQDERVFRVDRILELNLVEE